MPRRYATLQWEAARAMLALAGFRLVKQTSISVPTVTDGTYTVTEANTRRVVAIHNAPAAFDIRFDYNAPAVATDFPVLPQRYFVIDAAKGDVLHFFNNNAAAQTIFLMEID